MDEDILEKQNRIIDYQHREIGVLNGLIGLRDKEIKEMEAEIAALRRDADRYLYLRGANDQQRLEAEKWMCTHGPDRLDSAIDEAITNKETK